MQDLKLKITEFGQSGGEHWDLINLTPVQIHIIKEIGPFILTFGCLKSL